jgi:hypothetical protein
MSLVDNRHTMSYLEDAEGYVWDEAKNDLLKRTRNISFEVILAHMAGNDLLDVIDHPRPEKYPGQRVFIVRVGERVIAVPFLIDKEKTVLKTIIPGRKFKRIYEKEGRRETRS